jgi:surface antigen
MMRRVIGVSITKSGRIETNGLERHVRRVRLAGVLSVTLLLGGCGFGSPIFEQISDSMMPLTTGSILKSATPLSRDLTPEDWSIAEPILTAALEADKGKRFRWTNPETRRSGDFTATGDLSVSNDLLCRAFEARLLTKGAVQRKLTATACRGAAGEWAVTEVDGAEL